MAVKLSLKTDLATLTIGGSEKLLHALRAQETMLKGVTRAQAVEYDVAATQSAFEQRDNQWHATVVLAP